MNNVSWSNKIKLILFTHLRESNDYFCIKLFLFKKFAIADAKSSSFVNRHGFLGHKYAPPIDLKSISRISGGHLEIDQILILAGFSNRTTFSAILAPKTSKTSQNVAKSRKKSRITQIIIKIALNIKSGEKSRKFVGTKWLQIAPTVDI